MMHSEDWSSVRINHEHRPVQPEPRPKRRLPSRYIQRVQDSLNTRIVKLLCMVFIGFIFILSLIAFILWLSFRPHRPRIYIRDFEFPGLVNPNGYENTHLGFYLTARNPNQQIGIYYDALQVSLVYREQSIGLAKLSVPFYEPPDNSTVFRGVFTGATLGLSQEMWKEFQVDRVRGEVIFRLKTTATVRFKVYGWVSEHRKMHSVCDFGVGPEGFLLIHYRNKRCPVYFI